MKHDTAHNACFKHKQAAAAVARSYHQKAAEAAAGIQLTIAAAFQLWSILSQSLITPNKQLPHLAQLEVTDLLSC
jgi:hypothetical protein